MDASSRLNSFNQYYFQKVTVFVSKTFLRPGIDEEKLFHCLETSDPSDCDDISRENVNESGFSDDNPSIDTFLSELDPELQIEDDSEHDESLSELKKLLQKFVINCHNNKIQSTQNSSIKIRQDYGAFRT